MATNLERALLRGANSPWYRGAVASARMPDTKPRENWSDSLIARVSIGNVRGNAWKPGARDERGGNKIRIDTFVDGYQQFIAFLAPPLESCELAEASQPAFGLIGEGYANPSYRGDGYRWYSTCEEQKPEEMVLAGLLRSVRESPHARKLGTLDANKIRRLAQGKIILQARTAPLGNIGLTR